MASLWCELTRLKELSEHVGLTVETLCTMDADAVDELSEISQGWLEECQRQATLRQLRTPQ